MSYYRITIKVKKKIIKGIRELSNADIDYAWRYYEKKTYEKYSRDDVTFFEVVMLSKISPDVKGYLKRTKRHPTE